MILSPKFVPRAAAACLFLSLGLSFCPGALAQSPVVPSAYRAAAIDARVGPALFFAIALTESGQTEMTADYRPWPWTLSIDGAAYRYPTRDEAFAALLDAIRRGAGQLGVGIFQIEHRFHAHRFDSLSAMLDPYDNARVASEIFSEGLETAAGDVWVAVGLFHSATPEHADAYRRRVAKRLVNLIGKATNEG